MPTKAELESQVGWLQVDLKAEKERADRYRRDCAEAKKEKETLSTTLNEKLERVSKELEEVTAKLTETATMRDRLFEQVDSLIHHITKDERQ